MLKYKW